MVNPLNILKMLHCRGIAVKSTAPEKVITNKVNMSRPTNPQVKHLGDVHIKDEIITNEYLCRVCLREGNISLYNDEALIQALCTYAAIEIDENDPYPKHLCQQCNTLLEGALLLRKTAQESEDILKKQSKVEVNVAAADVIEAERDVDFVESYFEEDNEIIVNRKIKWLNKSSCSVCDKQFNTHEESSAHRLTGHKIKMAKSQHLPHNKNATHICDICGKQFKARAPLDRHRLTHFYDLPYQCAQCPYRGRFKESLKLHMRGHTGEKPYQCSDCPARFITKSNLNKHALTHKGHNFKCENDDCNKSFYTERDLNMHVKVVHAGIKDYKCRFCDKLFGYKKVMRKHEVKAHGREKLNYNRMPLYIQVQTMKQNGENPQETIP